MKDNHLQDWLYRFHRAWLSMYHQSARNNDTYICGLKATEELKQKKKDAEDAFNKLDELIRLYGVKK